MTEQTELLQSITQYTDLKGARWVLDESLKTKAQKLVEMYSEDLGHVKLGHVVFVRAMGVSSVKWLGKCRYLGKAEDQIVARHILATLGSLGMLDLSQLGGLGTELMDLRYIITLNDNAILCKAGAGPDGERIRDMIESITIFHEMLHIDSTMEGMVPHDTQDFANVLNRFGVEWSSGLITSEQLPQMDLGLDSQLEQSVDNLRELGATISIHRGRV